MMHITVGKVGTRSSVSLRGSGWGLDEAGLVDLIVGGEQRVVTVGVGGAEGLQVIMELASRQTGHTQGDDEGQLKLVGCTYVYSVDFNDLMLPSREAPNNS